MTPVTPVNVAASIGLSICGVRLAWRAWRRIPFGQVELALVVVAIGILVTLIVGCTGITSPSAPQCCEWLVPLDAQHQLDVVGPCGIGVATFGNRPIRRWRAEDCSAR